MFGPSPALFVAPVCLLVACGPTDPAEARRAEIRAVLVAHLEHEDALLAILEQHAADPASAAAELGRYLDRHGDAMRALCDQRRVLEADATALAIALRDLEPRMKRSFERRRALAENHPELMARLEVRTALATLDAL